MANTDLALVLIHWYNLGTDDGQQRYNIGTDDSQHWSILYHYTNYCTPDHNNNIIIWKGPL